MDTRRVVIAGLLASVVMGMMVMLAEAAVGAGFWAPVTFIGATVLRGLQTIDVPVPFVLGAVVLGLMGHMMNSVVLGALFTRLVARSAWVRAEVVIAGVVYGLAVFGIMWYGVLPVVDPVMLKLNAAAFAISHLAWGAVLGLLVSRFAGSMAEGFDLGRVPDEEGGL